MAADSRYCRRGDSIGERQSATSECRLALANQPHRRRAHDYRRGNLAHRTSPVAKIPGNVVSSPPASQADISRVNRTGQITYWRHPMAGQACQQIPRCQADFGHAGRGIPSQMLDQDNFIAFGVIQHLIGEVLRQQEAEPAWTQTHLFAQHCLFKRSRQVRNRGVRDLVE